MTDRPRAPHRAAVARTDQTWRAAVLAERAALLPVDKKLIERIGQPLNDEFRLATAWLGDRLLGAGCPTQEIVRIIASVPRICGRKWDMIWYQQGGIGPPALREMPIGLPWEVAQELARVLAERPGDSGSEVRDDD